VIAQVILGFVKPDGVGFEPWSLLISKPQVQFFRMPLLVYYFSFFKKKKKV